MSAVPQGAAAADGTVDADLDTVAFVPVAALDDVPDHGMVAATAGRHQLLLCRLGDDVFAVAATCTHLGAPLLEGRLEGGLVRCPWHGVRFDVRTGARVTVPSCADLRTHPAEVRDGTVWVGVVNG
ncbi:MAG TPA: non-heme iron oxygenase ferredoxin subunit [Acidimicrobiales bacterium]